MIYMKSISICKESKVTNIKKYIGLAQARRPILTLIGLFVLLCAGAAHSAAAVSNAHVTYVGSYGNGNVFILLDANLADPTCPAARVDIPGTHPSIKSILAMALTAKLSGLPVLVSTVGCFNFSIGASNYSFPTIDQSNASYFGFMP